MRFDSLYIYGQERASMVELDLPNQKYRNGKHCSFRWKNMPLEERQLYEHIADYKNRKRKCGDGETYMYRDVLNTNKQIKTQLAF